MSEDREQVKRMSDLLKSGATMLFEHCPVCNTPLFKIGDEVYCSKCNKRVLLVKDGREDSIKGLILLDEVEKTVMGKLQETTQLVKNEQDSAKLRELGGLLTVWLEILDRIKQITQKA